MKEIIGKMLYPIPHDVECFDFKDLCQHLGSRKDVPCGNYRLTAVLQKSFHDGKPVMHIAYVQIHPDEKLQDPADTVRDDIARAWASVDDPRQGELSI